MTIERLDGRRGVVRWTQCHISVGKYTLFTLLRYLQYTYPGSSLVKQSEVLVLSYSRTLHAGSDTGTIGANPTNFFSLQIILIIQSIGSSKGPQ